MWKKKEPKPHFKILEEIEVEEKENAEVLREFEVISGFIVVGFIIAFLVIEIIGLAKLDAKIFGY